MSTTSANLANARVLSLSHWEVNQGGDIVNLPNGEYSRDPKTKARLHSIFKYAKIPNKKDSKWKLAPLKEGKINYGTPNSSRLSWPQDYNKFRRVDFTYFRAFLDLRTNIESIKNAEIKIGYVDDQARMILFNSKNTKGYFIEANDAQKGGANFTTDFTDHLVQGEINTFIIIQADDNPRGNILNGGITVKINDNEIKPDSNWSIKHKSFLEEESYTDKKFVPKTDDLIPLGNNFHIELFGDVFKEKETHPILFDTGSWALCVPTKWLNQDKITVKERNVIDCWGKKANLVSGNITLISQDKKTSYTVEDYEFYEVTDSDQSRIICGGFFGYGEGQLDSLPYKIAMKKEQGFGIFSDSDGGNTDSTQFYLGFGLPTSKDEEKLDEKKLLWRKDIIKVDDKFSPQYIPGFSIRFDFENSKSLEFKDLVSTIDTGAPHLTLRLIGDPQNKDEEILKYFSKDNIPSWYYGKNCLNIIKDQNVTISFKDENNSIGSYSFKTSVDGNFNVYGGSDESDIPWQVDSNLFLKNRINLGNSIYYYCNVFYVDFTEEKVGILF